MAGIFENQGRNCKAGMIKFEKFTLGNGLRVVVNYDPSTPLVAMNILYMVGARNEDPSRTGLAHLFEHLMFGGSVNIPSYDEPLQQAGGENNAFTNNDITNYYLTIPSQNIETAFWLESDRMLSLAFSERSLDVQRNVVIEEFNQRYLNQPYGDAWLKLRPMAYKVHPYKWPTIGKEISHIRDTTLDDIKSFFSRHYHPGNAILTLSGNLSTAQAMELCEKWFGPIPHQPANTLKIPVEPEQHEKRILHESRDVPLNAIYKAWHCCSRSDKSFHATDLLTDILSNGKSSRLHNVLVKEKRLFSSINAYLLGDLDPSLVVVEGKLIDGIDFEHGEKAIDEELDILCQNEVDSRELKKVANKVISTMVFSNMSHEARAMNMAYYEMLGDAELMNSQDALYTAVTAAEIKSVAESVFRDSNSSVLYYHTGKI